MAASLEGLCSIRLSYGDTKTSLVDLTRLSLAVGTQAPPNYMSSAHYGSGPLKGAEAPYIINLLLRLP